MFVNNYFVGDNSWRPGTGEKQVRYVDKSRSRASTAVQTAVSFLGEEEDKTSSIVQAGLSRVKAMGSNYGRYKTQSPLVVEPMKNGNSTGWSTNSFNLPDIHQNTPDKQQCEGLPDFTMPPPSVQAQAQPQVPPALMDIPAFMGEEPEKCLEWITSIRNICRQSGCSFQQELTNKSGLVVQNFLATLNTNITENDLVEKILKMFSDIPTMTQAINKLKALQQGEGESILAYNQWYRTLVEHVEGRLIEEIISPVSMEMYLGTIISPLRKSIKNSLF